MATRSKKSPAKRGARKSKRAPRVSEVAQPLKHAASIRYGRNQLSVERTFNSAQIRVPLQASVTRALKSVFDSAIALAKRKKFPYELSSYTLTVQVARTATVKGGALRFNWARRDFIRLTSKLQTFGVKTLWEIFQDTALRKINDVDGAKTRLLTSPRVAFAGSDPLGMRPQKLVIYMQTADGPLKGLKGKKTSWKRKHPVGKKSRAAKSR